MRSRPRCSSWRAMPATSPRCSVRPTWCCPTSSAPSTPRSCRRSSPAVRPAGWPSSRAWSDRGGVFRPALAEAGLAVRDEVRGRRLVGSGGGRRVITVLVPPGISAGRREPLDESEQHHLRVRRAADGERVALRDGAGLVGQGRAGRGGGAAGRWKWRPSSWRRGRPELTLAVGAGDRERFAWLVEKAAELGATAIVPLETEHTRGVASRLRAAHVEKLQRQALEAMKQCGAAWAPARRGAGRDRRIPGARTVPVTDGWPTPGAPRAGRT